MNRNRLALAALLVLLALPVGAQTNIAGDWDVTIQSAQGSNNVQVTFKQDGSKVSGVFKSQMGELPFQDGTLEGNDLKFGFSIPIQGQSLDVTMTGKVDGASIAGKAQFGGFGEGDWTAKRMAGNGPSTSAAASAPVAHLDQRRHHWPQRQVGRDAEDADGRRSGQRGTHRVCRQADRHDRRPDGARSRSPARSTATRSSSRSGPDAAGRIPASR